MKKREVWGGILGALTIGASVVYFAYSDGEASIRSDTKYVLPLSAIPVAIGEESLFRGFLQAGLLRNMSPWGAITISSLAFAAAHIPNGLLLDEEYRRRYYSVSLPMITGFGAYLGWLANKNHSLKECVAMHTWYDFTLFLLKALGTASIQEQTSFSYNLAF